MIHIRRAGALDCTAMAELLNQIIARGGTTALTRPVSGDDLGAWMRSDPRAVWHIAEDDAGLLLGFQWVEPHPALGPQVAQIASFARVGRTGLGIGTRLFEATRAAAKAAGYAWINAEIRADNPGGLAYYQSRGFETYDIRRNVPLPGGATVDRISKRFDL